jgi:protein-disulfide isomerase
MWTPVGDSIGRVQSKADVLGGLTIPTERLRNVKGHARLAVVEFSDFECPACVKYARDTFPLIVKRLIDTGDLTYVHFHFPLDGIHQLAAKSSEAAECAGREGKYWEFYDYLFALSPHLSVHRLQMAAQSVGVDQTRFQQCLMGDATSTVRSDIGEGLRLGVVATPTLFIGTFQETGDLTLRKRFTGAVSFEELTRELADPK